MGQTLTRDTSSLLAVVCIPAYNEEDHIASVILRVKRHVSFIIVCDDGSNDLTGEIAESLGVTLLKHNKNKGYGACIKTLFDHAKIIDADIIVTIDADGQHNPDDIPILINKLIEENADIIIGSRFYARAKKRTNKVPFWREKGIQFITSLAHDEISDAQSGFRAYSRRAIDSLKITENGMGLSTEIIMKAQKNGLIIREVPITISYENNTPTQNPLMQGFDVMLSTLKYISIRKPLSFYGLPGLGSLIVSLIFWIWTLQIFSETQRVVTNITLIAIGTSIIGLSLVTTAIILWVLISVISEAMNKG